MSISCIIKDTKEHKIIMNISDIQTTLNRILKYNQNLNLEGLKILLEASDWKESDMKDALFLFKRNQDLDSLPNEAVVHIDPSIINVVSKVKIKNETPVNEVIKLPTKNELKKSYFKNNIESIEIKTEIKNEAEFLLPASISSDHLLFEEEMLPSAEVEPDYLLSSGINELEIGEATEVGIKQKTELQTVSPNLSVVLDLETKKETIRKILDEKPEDVLPSNLPLKPFDSSPHVLHFADYANSFFTEEERMKNSLGGKEARATLNESAFSKSKIKYQPLSEKEKKLARLASVFLVIILLLIMYMQNK